MNKFTRNYTGDWEEGLHGNKSFIIWNVETKNQITPDYYTSFNSIQYPCKTWLTHLIQLHPGPMRYFHSN